MTDKTESYRFEILDLSKIPKKKPLVFKEYEIWIGNHGYGQGEHPPTKPVQLSKGVKATSFKIACLIYEHQRLIDSLNDRMERNDSYIEDIHFGIWYYKPENNSNSWTGKYYESEQDALKSFGY